MTANNVQTLDENKRKRGRPVYPEITARNLGMAQLYAEHVRSRSGLYNKLAMLGVSQCAMRCGLVDEHFRNLVNGRRMNTKFVELARLFGREFWKSEHADEWLKRNWPDIVVLTVAELRAWVREHNPRARGGGAEVAA